MINANNLRQSREKEFESTFDFESFDKYIEVYFSNKKNTHLGIGIDRDWQTEKWAAEHGRKCKTLSFKENQSNYIWSSNIQVAQSVDDLVIKYLKKNGFVVSQKGACGYNHCDIITVSL